MVASGFRWVVVNDVESCSLRMVRGVRQGPSICAKLLGAASHRGWGGGGSIV
jgi:hypothetical protein